MKRIISVILTIAMFLGISIETFAAYGGEKSRAYQSENCTITYSIANEWSGNQQISVSITNDGEETLRNWAVMFDNAGEITNIWNAEVCRNDGELCVIRNNGYNYEIIPNATVEFGFMLQGEDLSLPEDISLCSRTADSTESAEISYEIQNNWGDGFIAAVTVKNTSDKPLEAWKLSFNGNFDISTIWNANLLYTNDGSFKVENDITTTPIPVGGEKVFSFQGVIASGETPVLSDFKLTSIVIETERTQPEPPVETEEAPSHETSEPSTGDEPDPATEETNETEEPVDPDPDENTILCFGEYLSEENSIKVYWYSTAEGAVSIHENTDGNGWKKLAEVTDGDFYEFTITEDFVIKYIKVSQQTADGMIESEPFIVAASEDGYVCTWLDSDNDGLPDYAEKIYGTDPENADTDGDGLSDYDEIYKTGTNPLKYDTDEDGVNDADSDNDKDGLTNSEELALGTNPNSADTDGDGLSDYDEINKHNTDPLKADSDDDTLSDGDEIILGLDPNDPETFGVPDAEYKVKQTISADSEVMERVNTEDSPYELSLEITASGNAQNLIAGSSIYSAITESDARLGGAVSLSYYGGDVEKVKLTYEIGESYISNEGSEYAKNCIDLQGIKRYNIFRYFEELNMLLPVATEFDEENNTLFAETDELGTYCVLDMEVLLQTFGVNPDGSQTEQVEMQMYAGVNDGYNICFIIDIRKDVITDEQLENIKNEIIAFMSNAVTNGKLIGVTICVQNYTDFSNNKSSAELLGHYSTVEELTAALKEVKLDNKYDDNDFVRCCITDGIGLLSYQSRGTNNYVFDIFSQTDCIFNRTKFDEIERNAISTGVNISFITDNRKIDSYQTEIPEETKGIVLISFSNFAKKAYNHVFEEPLVEFDGFSAILATGYQTVELKEELNSFNGCHSDDDNITDWDEVDVDYWASCGLITFDDNNNVVLPTVEQCMNYSEASYVVEALDRLQSELGKEFGDAIALQHIMPISSDPTQEDSDGDGIDDIDDDEPLVRILPNAKNIKDFLDTADLFEIQYMFDYLIIIKDNKIDCDSLESAIKYIEIFREYKGTNNPSGLIKRLLDEGIYGRDNIVAVFETIMPHQSTPARLLAEYENYSVGTNFAELSQKSYEEWTDNAKQAAIIWLFGASTTFCNSLEELDYSPWYKASLEQEHSIQKVTSAYKNIFSSKSYKHLTKIEGFDKNKNGCIGGHVLQLYENDTITYPAKSGGVTIRYIKIISKKESPRHNGVYSIRYQVGGIDSKSNQPTKEWISKIYHKTVFDSRVISEEQMICWAKEALSSAKKELLLNGNSIKIYGNASNGMKFEGWIDLSKQWVISFYPVLDE